MEKEKEEWKKLKKIEKENVEEIKRNIRKELHRCEIKEWGVIKKDGGFGQAIIFCYERDGMLFVDNDEYNNQVNFCPFCGHKAKIQIKAKVEKRIWTKVK